MQFLNNAKKNIFLPFSEFNICLPLDVVLSRLQLTLFFHPICIQTTVMTLSDSTSHSGYDRYSEKGLNWRSCTLSVKLWNRKYLNEPNAPSHFN